MIVHSYFDETGLDGRDDTYRWIGLLATADNWGAFANQWREVLRAEPAIQSWHTVSAHTGKLRHALTGNALSRVELAPKEARLCELIASFREKFYGIEINMSKADHHENVVGQVKETPIMKDLAKGLRASLEHAPLMMIRHSITAAAYVARLWASARPNNQEDPLQVWVAFEDNESHASLQDELCFAMQVLRKLINPTGRKLLGPVVFVESVGPNGMMPLQAVDLFAWHIRRSKDCVPPEGWSHLKRVPHNAVTVTSEWLRSQVHALNSNQRWDL